MKIELIDKPFEPLKWIDSYQKDRAELDKNFGATTIFVGTMRDFNEGDRVQSMELEHYPGMTEKHLYEIATTTMKKWDILDICIAHRIGEIFPADPIVCVGVWSAHRKDAYEANRHVMEELKSKAPLWKKEHLGGSSRWVEQNTKGF